MHQPSSHFCHPTDNLCTMLEKGTAFARHIRNRSLIGQMSKNMARDLLRIAQVIFKLSPLLKTHVSGKCTQLDDVSLDDQGGRQTLAI